VPTQTRHLSAADSVTLDATGAGQVQLTPGSEDWLILSTRVTCVMPLTTSPEPAVVTYRSTVSPSNQLDATPSGSSDTSDTRILLTAGETLIVTWTGGPPGQVATARVAGVATPPGQAIALYGGG
jgi:hypothetical protein